MNVLIFSAIGKIVSIPFFYDGVGIKLATTVDIPLNKEKVTENNWPYI